MRMRSDSNGALLARAGPVPFADDGRTFLEEVGRVADVVDGHRVLAVGDLEANALRRLVHRSVDDRAREPEPRRAFVGAVVHRLGHRAEVHDVVRQHDGEHDDRDDRNDATADRDDVPRSTWRSPRLGRWRGR